MNLSAEAANLALTSNPADVGLTGEQVMEIFFAATCKSEDDVLTFCTGEDGKRKLMCMTPDGSRYDPTYPCFNEKD